MLKDWIAGRGKKQNWLAYNPGVSEVSVRNWCRGKAKPSAEHLEKLSLFPVVDFQKNKIIYE